jgi:hypothetical protein
VEQRFKVLTALLVAGSFPIHVVGPSSCWAAPIGVWLSQSDVNALPTSGDAWTKVLASANAAISDPLQTGDQNSNANVQVLAKALAYARLGTAGYKTEVEKALTQVIGTQNQGPNKSCLSNGREVAAYVIAADLVEISGSLKTNFIAWLDTLISDSLFSCRVSPSTLNETLARDPTNHGTMVQGTMAAIHAYRQDSTSLANVARIFRGYLGDLSQYNGHNGWGNSGPSWQEDPSDSSTWRGIVRKGVVRQCTRLDGAIEDINRNGSWRIPYPPGSSGYHWGGFAGAIVCAEILYKNGYPTIYQDSDSALLRVVEMHHYLRSFTGHGGWWLDTQDEQFVIWIINKRYGTNYPVFFSGSGTHDDTGKNMAWTRWTHQ